MPPRLKRVGGRRIVAAMTLLSTLACGSCAYGYTDADGTRRIIGFVDMEIRPTADPLTIAGEVIDVRTFGLSLIGSEAGTSVALGWQRHIAASLHDNVLVLGNPLTALNDGRAREENGGEQ